MDSAFSTAIPDPSLAAIGQLSENSRLGFASRNPALHRGIEWSKSTLALGLPEWSGKTASGPAVAANNGLPGVPKPPNPITAVRSDGQKEAACEQQAKAAFGPLWTPQSLRSTAFGGVIGWILGKTAGAIGLGITTAQVANFDSKAMDYNATLQSCRQASGIGGLAQAVQVTP